MGTLDTMAELRTHVDFIRWRLRGTGAGVVHSFPNRLHLEDGEGSIRICINCEQQWKSLPLAGGRIRIVHWNAFGLYLNTMPTSSMWT